MVYYCQKRHFVNNRSFSFFDYCQKRSFVKNKNSERNPDFFVIMAFRPKSAPKNFGCYLYLTEEEIKNPDLMGFSIG